MIALKRATKYDRRRWRIRVGSHVTSRVFPSFVYKGDATLQRKEKSRRVISTQLDLLRIVSNWFHYRRRQLLPTRGSGDQLRL